MGFAMLSSGICFAILSSRFRLHGLEVRISIHPVKKKAKSKPVRFGETNWSTLEKLFGIKDIL